MYDLEQTVPRPPISDIKDDACDSRCEYADETEDCSTDDLSQYSKRSQGFFSKRQDPKPKFFKSLISKLKP